ncbi:MAG TPA: hypothetical protein DEH22_08230 [Chloroflexi bacterium]|nr:hypothetical protein [Chloroflexota bacterium]
MNPKRIIPIFVIIVLLIAAGGWYYLNIYLVDDSGMLSASGTVEATEILIAPELAGKLAQVYVSEGDAVNAGDPLFELDSDLLQAQRERAQTALDTAQATYNAAWAVTRDCSAAL